MTKQNHVDSQTKLYEGKGFLDIFWVASGSTTRAPASIRSCTLWFSGQHSSIWWLDESIWYAHYTFELWFWGGGFGIGRGCIEVTKFAIKSFKKSPLSGSGNGVKPYLFWAACLSEIDLKTSVPLVRGIHGMLGYAGRIEGGVDLCYMEMGWP